jgi:hypothetical protein
MGESAKCGKSKSGDIEYNFPVCKAAKISIKPSLDCEK